MRCFCEDLGELKKIKFAKKYTVALVSYDSKGNGTVTHYNYFRYKLNYCPECGRPLKRKYERKQGTFY